MASCIHGDDSYKQVTPSCVTFLCNTTGITGFSHKDNQLTGNTWQLLYLGQFGTDSVLRDDCQTAVLLQRQAEKSTSWMQHRNKQSQTFFSFTSPQDWLKIFSLKPSSTFRFQTVLTLSTTPNTWIYQQESRTEVSSNTTVLWAWGQNRLQTLAETFFNYVYIYISYIELSDKFSLMRAANMSFN